MDKRLSGMLKAIHREINTAGGGGHRIGVFSDAEIAAQMRQSEMRAASRARGEAEWAEEMVKRRAREQSSAHAK
jgi:hypothetical protein